MKLNYSVFIFLFQTFLIGRIGVILELMYSCEVFLSRCLKFNGSLIKDLIQVLLFHGSYFRYWQTRRSGGVSSWRSWFVVLRQKKRNQDAGTLGRFAVSFAICRHAFIWCQSTGTEVGDIHKNELTALFWWHCSSHQSCPHNRGGPKTAFLELSSTNGH